MNLRLLIIVALICLAAGAGIGILGYTWLVGGSGEASAPISAPTLDANAVPTLNPTQAFDALTQVARLNSEITGLQATLGALEANQAQGAPAEATTPIPAEAAPTESAASERALFRIDNTSSLVTFMLQEDLRGVRTDVVGTTREVAGDIVIDLKDPALSQVGTIRINARTLTTDSENRNRALRAEILRSAQDQYEFIEFVPTRLVGLPDTIASGETYTFDIIGNLTIAGVTQEVTFSTTASLASEAELTGSASTTVRYADWGITIPRVPFVANVTEDVTLTIQFVANRIQA